MEWLMMVLALVVGVAIGYRLRPKPKPAMSRSEFVDKARTIAMELFEEERANVSKQERVSEYNAGYQQAMEDVLVAKVPEVKKEGGFLSYTVAGHYVGIRPDGRLTLKAH